jgi:RNA polymerase sigma factor (sigma-70 family)
MGSGNSLFRRQKGPHLNQSEWLKKQVRDFEGPLLSFACRIVPQEQAREIVQEAFLKIWKEDARSLQGREKQWLFLVVRNHAFDLLKKTKRDVSDESVMARQADPGLRADEKIEEREKTNQLLERMKRLSKPQEEVIKLKFIDGFGYKEISSITGHSTSYVGVLIHEAIKILKTEEGQI